MLEFLTGHYLLILSVLSILIEVIILLVKRKPKTLDDFFDILNESVASVLPFYIASVEEEGHGSEKKFRVVNMMKTFIEKKLGRKLSSKEVKIFETFISDRIEQILETPQKKGQ